MKYIFKLSLVLALILELFFRYQILIAQSKNIQNKYFQLPEYQSIELSLIKDNQKIITSNISIKKEKLTQNIIYRNQWPEGKIIAILNKDLILQKAIKIDNSGTQKVRISFQNKIINLPYNKRITEYQSQNSSVYIQYYWDDKKLTDYSLKITPKSIDIELLGLYLENMLYKHQVEKTNIDLILPDMRRLLNVDINYTFTNDFTLVSPEYKFPKKILRVLPLKEQLIAFIVKATGFTSFFYPHKFYVFFEKDPPYRLMAWWGGSPKEVLFFIASELLKN